MVIRTGTFVWLATLSTLSLSGVACSVDAEFPDPPTLPPGVVDRFDLGGVPDVLPGDTGQLADSDAALDQSDGVPSPDLAADVGAADGVPGPDMAPDMVADAVQDMAIVDQCPDTTPMGFGAQTRGGDDGVEIVVTSHDDSGPGTLREALLTPGARRVVFQNPGVITLASDIWMTEGNLTLDGNVGGEGITIANGSIEIVAPDVIIRNLSMRGSGGCSNSALGIYSPARNVLIEHVSVSWATRHNIILWADWDVQPVRDVTIAWSIFSETRGDCGNVSSSVATWGNVENVSIHHNLIAESHHGAIVQGVEGPVEYIQNVIYNRQWEAYLGPPWDNVTIEADFIGNHWIDGAETPALQPPVGASTEGLGNVDIALYLEQNISSSRPTNGSPETDIMIDWARDPSLFESTPRVSSSTVKVCPADSVREAVLTKAGATLPCRDQIDARVVNNVRNGSGGLINNPADVGGLMTACAP